VREAPRLVLEDLQAAQKPFPHETGMVKGPEHLAPLSDVASDHDPVGLEGLTLARQQIRKAGFSARRDDDEPPRAHDAGELVAPGLAGLAREVREDGKRVRAVERIRFEG
jgi:hypothetical protein